MQDSVEKNQPASPLCPLRRLFAHCQAQASAAESPHDLIRDGVMQSNWMWVALGLVVVAAVLAFWKFVRIPPSRNDRYVAEALLTPAQTILLQYLQTAFPGQVVLSNVPLHHIVSVRQAANFQRAKQRLDSFQVDFVVCADNGKAAFAFDVEAYRTGDKAAAQNDAEVKNRILKSAGIRLVYIKGRSSQLPTPNEFRQKLSLAALAEPKEPSRETRKRLERHLSRRDSEFRPEFRESEVMGISGLMGLDAQQPAPSDPWRSSRN
ncbi:MAG: DUF2726 domain-containing protein [Burkholderiaceae bacterium]